MNSRNIPEWLEEKVKNRDLNCVYCRTPFDKSIKKHSSTREHIINDARIITEDNIALCCCSCNASKWAKDLLIWLTSNYCKNKNITIDTVAPIIKKATQELLLK
jgi:hypothetical protein